MLEEIHKKPSRIRDWWQKLLAKKSSPKNRKNADPDASEKVFLGLARYIRRGNEWVLHPRWRVIAPALAVFSIFFYAAIATGKYCIERYYYNLKETPYFEMYVYVIPNRIPFTSFTILPDFLNRYVMEARKRQQILAVKTVAKAPQSIHDLFWVAKTQPENIEMQFQAAHFLAAPDWFNAPADAMLVLENTLPYIVKDTKNTMTYLGYLYNFCSEYEQDDRLIAAARKYLPDPGLAPDARISLASALAEALYLRGFFAEVDALLNEYQLHTTLTGVSLRVKIIWENGEQERAIRMLEHYIGISPDAESREQLLYTLVRFYHLRGESEKAINTLGIISEINPENHTSRISALNILTKENDPDGKRQEVLVAEVLSRFGTREAAILELGNYAVKNGDVALQRKLEKHAFDNHFKKLSNFRFLVIETLVAAGANKEALDNIKDIFFQKPVWLQRSPTLQAQFETLRMIAYFADGQAELGRVTLSRLAGLNISPTAAVASARRLLTLGYADEAKQLLLHVWTRNNRRQDILLELIKMELKAPSTELLSEYLTRLLDGRRPPRNVLQEAYTYLASDRFLFSPNRSALVERVDSMLNTLKFPPTEHEKKLLESPVSREIPVKPDLFSIP